MTRAAAGAAKAGPGVMAVLKLVVCIGGCQLVGLAGSRLTRPALPVWYRGLEKPPLTPPDWAFAVVWPTLFLLMGLAAWLVWRRGIDAPGVRGALGAFVAQLALNLAWSAAFFGLRSPLLALAVIAALLAMIALTALRFRRISPPAGALMAPYLLWVGFAAYLNAAIWALNA